MDKVVDHPAQILNGGIEHLAMGVGVSGGSPPRGRHNDREQATRSGDVQPIPVSVPGVVAGVRPRFGRPPLRLAATPPGNPIFTELLEVGDGGGEIALARPDSNFFGAVLQG